MPMTNDYVSWTKAPRRRPRRRANGTAARLHALPRCFIHVVFALGVMNYIAAGAQSAEPSQAVAQIRFQVFTASSEPLPCRIHLRNEQGEAQRADGLPFWRDHFVCSGDVTLDVKPGRYEYEIERGPEHQRASGTLDVTTDKMSVMRAKLHRLTNLRGEGWYSGDLHVHRPLDHIEQLMLAEDLDFAPVITWWNTRNPWRDADLPPTTLKRVAGHRLYDVMAGEDEREGGALLFFGLDRPIDLSAASREYPSPLAFAAQARARNANVWIDIEKPFWWDVPTWLASGIANSIGLANNHMCHSQMLPNEAWGRPRDRTRLPDPLGNGFWTQEIYYHLLNAGLRIPPSAGSASGVLPNPVGYNRVYVYIEEAFTEESWFESLARGRCFVTNGPLLRVTANDQLPGTTLKIDDKRPLHIDLAWRLASNDRVQRLEVIHNGQIVSTIDCPDTLESDSHHTARITLEEPGWFLIRAMADVEHTFRFASTAPWYIVSATIERRISRTSCQMFSAWVQQRMARTRENVTDSAQLQAVLEPHTFALNFWQQRAAAANADLQGEPSPIEQTSRATD